MSIFLKLLIIGIAFIKYANFHNRSFYGNLVGKVEAYLQPVIDLDGLDSLYKCFVDIGPMTEVKPQC